MTRQVTKGRRTSTFKPSYRRREFTTVKAILKQKLGVNRFFLKNLLKRKDGKVLIVDSFKEQTRNIIKSGKIPDKNIHTIDLECENPGPLRFKISLKQYCEETDCKYDNIFADVINNVRRSIDQVSPLFKLNKLNKGGILAITFCPRGDKKRIVGSFNWRIKSLAKKYGYTLKELDVPKKLILTPKTSTMPLKSHMADNGSFERTGRTITAFYRIK
jgi:hypothetical protein